MSEKETPLEAAIREAREVSEARREAYTNYKKSVDEALMDQVLAARYSGVPWHLLPQTAQVGFLAFWRAMQEESASAFDFELREPL